MLIQIEVTSDKRGAVLHLSGETVSCLTDVEIDISVERVKGAVDAAAAKAKRAIRAELKKEVYV